MISKAENAAGHHHHTPTEKPRIGMINRLEMEQGITVTHFLKAKDKHDQQARIVARYHSLSPPEEPRICIISRLQWQQGITATHFLESQGGMISRLQLQQGTQPLTYWRAKNRHHQLAKTQ